MTIFLIIFEYFLKGGGQSEEASAVESELLPVVNIFAARLFFIAYSLHVLLCFFVFVGRLYARSRRLRQLVIANGGGAAGDRTTQELNFYLNRQSPATQAAPGAVDQATLMAELDLTVSIVTIVACVSSIIASLVSPVLGVIGCLCGCLLSLIRIETVAQFVLDLVLCRKRVTLAVYSGRNNSGEGGPGRSLLDMSFFRNTTGSSARGVRGEGEATGPRAARRGRELHDDRRDATSDSFAKRRRRLQLPSSQDDPASWEEAGADVASPGGREPSETEQRRFQMSQLAVLKATFCHLEKMPASASSDKNCSSASTMPNTSTVMNNYSQDLALQVHQACEQSVEVPSDVLIQNVICAFLAVEDVVALGCTCKSLQKGVLQNRDVWLGLLHRDFHDQGDQCLYNYGRSNLIHGCCGMSRRLLAGDENELDGVEQLGSNYTCFNKAGTKSSSALCLYLPQDQAASLIIEPFAEGENREDHADADGKPGTKVVEQPRKPASGAWNSVQELQEVRALLDPFEPVLLGRERAEILAPDEDEGEPAFPESESGDEELDVDDERLRAIRNFFLRSEVDNDDDEDRPRIVQPVDLLQFLIRSTRGGGGDGPPRARQQEGETTAAARTSAPAAGSGRLSGSAGDQSSASAARQEDSDSDDMAAFATYFDPSGERSMSDNNDRSRRARGSQNRTTRTSNSPAQQVEARREEARRDEAPSRGAHSTESGIDPLARLSSGSSSSAVGGDWFYNLGNTSPADAVDDIFNNPPSMVQMLSSDNYGGSQLDVENEQMTAAAREVRGEGELVPAAAEESQDRQEGNESDHEIELRQIMETSNEGIDSSSHGDINGNENVADENEAGAGRSDGRGSVCAAPGLKAIGEATSAGSVIPATFSAQSSTSLVAAASPETSAIRPPEAIVSSFDSVRLQTESSFKKTPASSSSLTAPCPKSNLDAKRGGKKNKGNLERTPSSSDVDSTFILSSESPPKDVYHVVESGIELGEDFENANEILDANKNSDGSPGNNSKGDGPHQVEATEKAQNGKKIDVALVEAPKIPEVVRNIEVEANSTGSNHLGASSSSDFAEVSEVVKTTSQDEDVDVEFEARCRAESKLLRDIYLHNERIDRSERLFVRQVRNRGFREREGHVMFSALGGRLFAWSGFTNQMPLLATEPLGRSVLPSASLALRWKPVETSTVQASAPTPRMHYGHTCVVLKDNGRDACEVLIFGGFLSGGYHNASPDFLLLKIFGEQVETDAVGVVANGVHPEQTMRYSEERQPLLSSGSSGDQESSSSSSSPVVVGTPSGRDSDPQEEQGVEAETGDDAPQEVDHAYGERDVEAETTSTSATKGEAGRTTEREVEKKKAVWKLRCTWEVKTQDVISVASNRAFLPRAYSAAVALPEDGVGSTVRQILAQHSSKRETTQGRGGGSSVPNSPQSRRDSGSPASLNSALRQSSRPSSPPNNMESNNMYSPSSVVQQDQSLLCEKQQQNPMVMMFSGLTDMGVDEVVAFLCTETWRLYGPFNQGNVLELERAAQDCNLKMWPGSLLAKKYGSSPPQTQTQPSSTSLASPPAIFTEDHATSTAAETGFFEINAALFPDGKSEARDCDTASNVLTTSWNMKRSEDQDQEEDSTSSSGEDEEFLRPWEFSDSRVFRSRKRRRVVVTPRTKQEGEASCSNRTSSTSRSIFEDGIRPMHDPTMPRTTEGKRNEATTNAATVQDFTLSEELHQGNNSSTNFGMLYDAPFVDAHTSTTRHQTFSTVPPNTVSGGMMWPLGRLGHSMTLDGDEVIVFGGSTGRDLLRSGNDCFGHELWIFCLSTMKWRCMSSPALTNGTALRQRRLEAQKAFLQVSSSSSSTTGRGRAKLDHVIGGDPATARDEDLLSEPPEERSTSRTRAGDSTTSSASGTTGTGGTGTMPRGPSATRIEGTNALDTFGGGTPVLGRAHMAARVANTIVFFGGGRHVSRELVCFNVRKRKWVAPEMQVRDETGAYHNPATEGYPYPRGCLSGAAAAVLDTVFVVAGWQNSGSCNNVIALRFEPFQP
ncbi:unnamed protein product [Amoebophrya sp. A25]|nr:unnamed protein product [Amoebophrya sp. A25]|eukprot:GSA25T00008855001.1